nr:hypothetical protein CFP56_78951 [Quercus suber]
MASVKKYLELQVCLSWSHHSNYKKPTTPSLLFSPIQSDHTTVATLRLSTASTRHPKPPPPPQKKKNPVCQLRKPHVAKVETDVGELESISEGLSCEDFGSE